MKGVVFLTLVVMVALTVIMLALLVFVRPQHPRQRAAAHNSDCAMIALTVVVLALLVLVRPGESAAAGDSHRAVAEGVASRRGEQRLQSP